MSRATSRRSLVLDLGLFRIRALYNLNDFILHGRRIDTALNGFLLDFYWFPKMAYEIFRFD